MSDESLKDPKKATPGEDFDPEQSNLIKEPDDWVSGGEPMTGAQASYLKTLCEEAGEEFDPELSKARASKEIDRLKKKVNRDSSR